MITRKEKILWILLGAALVVLFLLSSTDLIIKEEERKIYPISVIVEDADDANYVNFRKGMDQAAIEQNADVSFITLYEAGSTKQQLSLVDREQQDGAAALVVAPAGGKDAASAIISRASVPLVMAWTSENAAGAAGVVTTDFGQMGTALASRIGEDWADGVPVYLFARSLENESDAEFYAALAGKLEEEGFYPRLTVRKNAESYRDVLDGLAAQGVRRAVVAALDPESLEETASLLEAEDSLSACVGALYGRGSTLAVLNGLDRGTIRGICVTDEFSAGYLSIWQAVEAAKGRPAKERVVLENYYIEKEDLRTSKYEKMLYPIE